ncbi:unnamed protein product [Soboliphyme baturini]|uniref:PSI domain-containing protein n=1 Tax=Soboliphyme baturini TaxID=241478 RepID=A0A183IGN4_9BILA|nr:unnamed protein product [Soboliphyme baturini]
MYKPDMQQFSKHWIDIPHLLENKNTTRGELRHKQLSNSYRRAVSQRLSFKFPFYGHMTENITIATGGFAYVGEHVHSWLAATQYIAPLMANFDTTTSDESRILYADTGKEFVVEWNQVVLRNQEEAGNFTFQLSLHDNGDIWFVYKDIPVEVKEINDFRHPRKVGLSDAYLFTHKILNSNRRIIYEYHRVEVPLTEVRSGAVVEIKANPVCMAIDNCWDCLNVTLRGFNCSWCSVPASAGGSFCSDEAGLHRRRQEWLFYSCNKQNHQVYCTGDEPGTGSIHEPPPDIQTNFSMSTSPGESLHSTPLTVPTNTAPRNTDLSSESPLSTFLTDIDNSTAPNHMVSRESVTVMKIEGKVPYVLKKFFSLSFAKHFRTQSYLVCLDHRKMSPSGVVAILFFVGTTICVMGWVVYAYLNPQTSSGQFLIRYRPSRWRLSNNRSDIRYTASVHM